MLWVRTKLAAAALLLGLAFLTCLRGVDATIEWQRFSGRYELHPGYVEAVETLTITFLGRGMVLSSESLDPMPNLTHIRFESSERQINWSYDGETLRWTYDPPLLDGDTFTYTRRWVENLSAGPSGLRTLVVPLRPASEASLAFTTKGVDITYSNLPLSADGSYSGPVNVEGCVVRYGTTYKLFTYRWRGTIQNMGARPAKVALNVSIPWDGQFQHVLSDPEGIIVQDRLGNRWYHVEETVPQGGSRDVEVEVRALTQTWPDGFQLNMSIAREGLLRPDADYWQSEDPRIQQFALGLANGTSDRLDQIRALALGVHRYLNYSIEPGRMGALWALVNGGGACMEYTDLFVAAARSLGIPALYVSGVCGASSVEGFGHAWAIAELSNGTWIGTDPTSGYVGRLDSGRLLLQFCNPADVGASLRCTRGVARIDSWSRTWEYRELSEEEAHRILGIAEQPLAAFTICVFLLAILSTRRPLNRASF